VKAAAAELVTALREARTRLAPAAHRSVTYR